MRVTPQLAVIGAEEEGVHAMGDCSYVTPDKLSVKANSLFDVSDGWRGNKGGMEDECISNTLYRVD